MFCLKCASVLYVGVHMCVCIDTEVQVCLSGIVLFVNKVHYHL